MRSSHLLCVFKTLANLVDAPSGLEWRQSLANVHEVTKVTAFDELHCEIVETPFVADVQDRHNIRMDKLLANPRFSFKAGDRSRIIDPAFAKQLQGDDAVVVR